MGPIAEWLARIEFKLDTLLRAIAKPMYLSTPMEFSTDPCPVCKEAVQYQLHHQLGYVLRRCGCKTGKIPSTIPLVPVGDNNGDTNRSRRETSNKATDSEISEGGSTGETSPRRVRR